MKLLRLILRALVMVLCLVFHIIWVVVPGIFKAKNLDHALRTKQIWLGWALKMLGIRIERTGNPPPGCHIFVGNHRSYLDGIIVMDDVRAVPVVKAEMESWPLIGYGARLTGIIFVKREDKQSRSKTLDDMQKMLSLGYSIIIYPEGTTHSGPTTIDFRTGSFNLAAKNGFSIVPMAIDYAELGDAWVGEETFTKHFLRYFVKKQNRVKLRYGPPLQSDDVNFLVTETKRWIDENMLHIRQEFETEKQASAFRR